MSVLAVIPCLNEEEHLPQLLAQMMNDPAIDLLVVADGGSTDRSRDITLELARIERVVLLDNPARIQSGGVNLAVREHGEGHDWLLRVDAHCLYPDNYASILLDAAHSRDASAVVVPMETIGHSGLQKAAAAAQNSILGTGGSAHRHLGAGQFVEHGHHALMRMELFKRIGGYCEAMPCNEDAELDHRQVQAGGRIWLEPAAAITYFPRSDLGALWRQYRRYGQGRARNLRRHRMTPRLRQLVPLAVPAALGLLPFAILHPVFALPAFAWAALCLTFGAIVGIRAGGGFALLAGPAAMTMQLGWAIGFVAEWICNPRSAAPRYGLAEPPGATREGDHPPT
jgi:succinoglycan biosynthesis protein ExoA